MKVSRSPSCKWEAQRQCSSADQPQEQAARQTPDLCPSGCSGCARNTRWSRYSL